MTIYPCLTSQTDIRRTIKSGLTDYSPLVFALHFRNVTTSRLPISSMRLQHCTLFDHLVYFYSSAHNSEKLVVGAEHVIFLTCSSDGTNVPQTDQKRFAWMQGNLINCGEIQTVVIHSNSYSQKIMDDFRFTLLR